MSAPTSPTVSHRPFASLPETDLGWVRMRDHFVLTVGPRSGSGQPFSDLVVLADATFSPRGRFELHAHRDIEVLSLVLSGELTHFEPTGSLTLPTGSVQLMSAGEGIVHAEGNATDEPVRMLQIWVRPRSPGGSPEHVVEPPAILDTTLRRISPASLRQDASLSMARLPSGARLHLGPSPGRVFYTLCFGGRARVGETVLGDGDALVVHDAAVDLEAESEVRVVVVDVRRPD